MKKGVRSAENEKARETAVATIKGSLKIQNLRDAFPPGTYPAEEIGGSALANLRRIAAEVANLTKFQALISKACRDSKGRPIPLRWSHTSSMLDAIKNVTT